MSTVPVRVPSVSPRPAVRLPDGPRLVIYFRRGGGRSIGSDRTRINHVPVPGRPFLSRTTRKQRARLLMGRRWAANGFLPFYRLVHYGRGRTQWDDDDVCGPCIRQVPAESPGKGARGEVQRRHTVSRTR